MAKHRPLKVTYDIHEICLVNPRMSPEAYEVFKADIAENGPKDDVTIWADEENGGVVKVIDGSHRVRACTELNIQYGVWEFKGTYEEMVDWTISKNVHRRHLTETQRAAIHQKAAWLKAANRNRKAGRPEGAKEGDVTEDSIADIAKKSGASKATVKRVRSAAKKNEELLQEMIDGKKSAWQADIEASEAKLIGSTEPINSESGEDGEGECDVVLSIADAAGERMKAFNRQLDAAAKEVMNAVDSLPTGIDDSTMGIIRGQLKAAAGTIRQQKGEGLCPYCRAEGCDRCNQRGFLNKTSLAAVPPNVRDAAEIEWAKAA